MQERFQPNFSERIRQSDAAKLANLEAFKAALASDGQNSAESDGKASEMPSVVATASTDSKVSSSPKPLLRWVPKRFRTPLLVATAGAAALGAAACTSGSGSSPEVPQAPVNQGEVLGGAHATSVSSVSAENTQSPKKELKQAPDFTLKDKNGIPLSLHDLRGQPVMIEYSEGNCPPCRRESNKLSEIMKKYASQGLVVLNVSIGADENFSPDVPLLLDPKMEFAKLYIVPGNVVPATYFIDGKGNLVDSPQTFSLDNNDLGLLADAFMAGKDLENVLPTPTPKPTPTPLGPTNPDLESNVGNEAVVDLGNYDFAVTKWQDLGVRQESPVRTIVMEGIVRNKTDRVIALDNSLPTIIEGFDVWILDKNGNNFSSTSYDSYLPLIQSGGLFNQPFEQANNGGLADVSVDYQYDPARATALMAPGFGLPVVLKLGVPADAENIQVAFDSQRDHTRQIVRQGQTDPGFSLISKNAEISSLDETLHVNIPGNLATDLEYKVEGFTKAKLPNSVQRDVVVFRVISHSGVMKAPFVLFKGQLYLRDGRVIPIANDYNLQIAPGQSQPFGLNVGELPPDKAFDTRAPGSISPSAVADAYKFDLKGSTLVVFTLGSNPPVRAWKMPDTLNIPIGKGGE
jgi:peroxiredoxin